MTAVMSQPQRVSTETYVERELLRHEGDLIHFRFRLMWEGTQIGMTTIAVPFGSSAQHIDSVGMSALLRVLSA